jgi:hypothetical protein
MKMRPQLTTCLAGALLLLSTSLSSAEENGPLPGISDAVTNTECTACHMAYTPSFLPKRSWHAIMSDLGNHFGEDASLDAETTKHISDYLEANAADTGGNTPGIMRGLASSDTPMRISELPIIVAIHREVGSRWRKKVGSMSRCTACHQ